MQPKQSEQQQAQNLYFQTELSNTEIAKIVGVSDRTIARWITKENWKNIKQAARHAPSAIVEKLYFQVNELTDHIISREPGTRFACREEADTIRKLTAAIDKLKQQAGLGETIDIMMRFTSFVAGRNLELAKLITLEANSFMKGGKGEHIKPYELNYGNDDGDSLYDDSIDPIDDKDGQCPAVEEVTVQPATVADVTEVTHTKNDPPLSGKNSIVTPTVPANQPLKEVPPHRNDQAQIALESWQRYIDELKE